MQHIREQILTYQPQATRVAEPVKLERLRPRTLLTVAAGLVAAYLVLYQLASAGSSISPANILGTASPWWAIVAVSASVMTYVAAGMVLTGFIPEQLPVVRNFLVQVAAGFVSIVAPAAVGGVALNTRYLQKQGIGTGPAVSAVGASQAVGFIMHIALIAAFSFIANTGTGGHSWAPSTVVIAILLAIGVVAMVTIGVKPLRRFAVARLKPFFEGTLPRLMDVAQNPRKLSIGLGGTILLSLMNALCLWASILTIKPDANISYATTAVVFLTAQAIGSVIPVPSGIGTVELAMAGALTSIGGLPATVGTPAVFIFRLLRTYLPVVPGYFAFVHLQRKGAL